MDALIDPCLLADRPAARIRGWGSRTVISCVHTLVAAKALRDEAASSERVGHRLLEFRANASPLSTQELVRLDHLEGDDPERFAGEMWEIHEDFGLPVLGGCCGTDDRHMRALAARMAPTGSTS
jgi:methionine synthase I (cobalamin-dependent)